MLSVLALALLDAPAYAHALVLLAWGMAGVLWLRGDVEASLRPIFESASQPVAVNPAEPAWQNWVAGWYWETDAEGFLRSFRPGAGMPSELPIDWADLSAALALAPKWLSCWAAADVGTPQLARMAHAFEMRQAWADALTVPWPSELRGLGQAAAAGWTCQVRAELRRAADGRFEGFRGVLVPVPPRAAAGMAPGSGRDGARHGAPDGMSAERAAQREQAQLEAARMREAEQEALRYAISHDLRAPLRVVEGFTRIVKEDYGRLLDRLGQDHLDRVLAASARMNGMIDAILEQAQLAGAPLQRVPVDLSSLAREIGGDLMAMASERAAVAFEVADGLHIDADPQLVRRVLENLIGNAFKYSAKVAQPRVEVGVMPATNPAVFFVRDNGAGFDMQHADKLFGMFQRLHSAKEFPGTGVGLAGVQNIIRRHGGRVWAEACPGQGACFYFTLMDTLEAQQRSNARG